MKVKEAFEASATIVPGCFYRVIAVDENGNQSLVFDEIEEMDSVSEEWLRLIEGFEAEGFSIEVERDNFGRPIIVVEVVIFEKMAEFCDECEVSK